MGSILQTIDDSTFIPEEMIQVEEYDDADEDESQGTTSVESTVEKRRTSLKERINMAEFDFEDIAES